MTHLDTDCYTPEHAANELIRTGLSAFLSMNPVHDEPDEAISPNAGPVATMKGSASPVESNYGDSGPDGEAGGEHA
jgi:hypothetical protein